jgi:hypothetical protein
LDKEGLGVVDSIADPLFSYTFPVRSFIFERGYSLLLLCAFCGASL